MSYLAPHREPTYPITKKCETLSQALIDKLMSPDDFEAMYHALLAEVESFDAAELPFEWANFQDCIADCGRYRVIHQIVTDCRSLLDMLVTRQMGGQYNDLHETVEEQIETYVELGGDPQWIEEWVAVRYEKAKAERETEMFTMISKLKFAFKEQHVSKNQMDDWFHFLQTVVTAYQQLGCDPLQFEPYASFEYGQDDIDTYTSKILPIIEAIKAQAKALYESLPEYAEKLSDLTELDGFLMAFKTLVDIVRKGEVDSNGEMGFIRELSDLDTAILTLVLAEKESLSSALKDLTMDTDEFRDRLYYLKETLEQYKRLPKDPTCSRRGETTVQEFVEEAGHYRSKATIEKDITTACITLTEALEASKERISKEEFETIFQQLNKDITAFTAYYEDTWLENWLDFNPAHIEAWNDFQRHYYARAQGYLYESERS